MDDRPEVDLLALDRVGGLVVAFSTQSSRTRHVELTSGLFEAAPALALPAGAHRPRDEDPVVHRLEDEVDHDRRPIRNVRAAHGRARRLRPSLRREGAAAGARAARAATGATSERRSR